MPTVAGAYVVDSEGTRMLDGVGGMWCVNIGYAREEMVQAIADQVRRIAYCSPFGLIATPPAIELGARLAAYAPGDLRHVFFTTGGSTAVDSALRFVQFYFNCIGRTNGPLHDTDHARNLSRATRDILLPFLWLY